MANTKKKIRGLYQFRVLFFHLSSFQWVWWIFHLLPSLSLAISPFRFAPLFCAFSDWMRNCIAHTHELIGMRQRTKSNYTENKCIGKMESLHLECKLHSLQQQTVSIQYSAIIMIIAMDENTCLHPHIAVHLCGPNATDWSDFYVAHFSTFTTATWWGVVVSLARQFMCKLFVVHWSGN